MKGSSFLNRMQFGYTRSRLDGVDYLLEGFSMPQTTFTDINRGLAALGVTGLSGLGGDTTNPKFHIFNNYQIRENVTWNRGIQNIKFGGDMQILQYALTSDFTSMGQYTFSSLDNFLISRVNQFNAVVPGSDASRDLRQMAFGFYVQDDIQARKNLTINLGLRYEPTNSVTDTQDRLAQLIDFTSPTATLNDTTTLTKLFKNPSLKTVAPRVGFAWDVAGDGKTAIRGGVGMFYDLVADQHAVRAEHRRPRAALLQSRRPGRVEHLRRELPRCRTRRRPRSSPRRRSSKAFSTISTSR